MSKHDNIVCLEYRVKKSFEGKYFIGQTPILSIGDNINSWGGLINPKDSGVNLYLNTFTVSNSSSTPFHAQLWLNSKPIGKKAISPLVSPANTAKIPLPKPKANLAYAQSVFDTPSDGVNILTRIAEANSTVVGNYYGKIIVPPRGTIIVFLYSPGTQPINAEVALGWWEEKAKKTD